MCVCRATALSQPTEEAELYVSEVSETAARHATHKTAGRPGAVGDGPSALTQTAMKDDQRPTEYRLRLYVAGETVMSRKARSNLQRLCENCTNPVETIVIDVLAEPSVADEARILATPTLVYDHPTRSKRIIGDLSDVEKVIAFLGLHQRDEGT